MKIEDLKKLGELASPAPWKAAPSWEQGYYNSRPHKVSPAVRGWTQVESDKAFDDDIWRQPKYDSDFIAAARNHWDKIIDLLEAVETYLKEVSICEYVNLRDKYADLRDY